jgi:hypothetical protein
MSIAALIIAAILAWCFARSPGIVLALVAVLAAVLWGDVKAGTNIRAVSAFLP